MCVGMPVRTLNSMFGVKELRVRACAAAGFDSGWWLFGAGETLGLVQLGDVPIRTAGIGLSRAGSDALLAFSAAGS